MKLQNFAKPEWWIASTLCVLLIVMFIGPRFASALLAIIFVTSLVLSLRDRGSDLSASVSVKAVPYSIVAFAGFAALSSLWSFAPNESVLKSLLLILLVACVVAGGSAMERLSVSQVRFLNEAVLVACAIGFALVGFEIVTNQGIARTIYNTLPALFEGREKHVTVVDGVVTAVSETSINRRMAVAGLLFWPLVLLIRRDDVAARRWIIGAMIGFGVTAILINGSHQSTQLALLASGLVFAAAVAERTLTRRAMMALWGIIIVLAVPLASTLYHIGAHKAEWLPHSARHRVVIWSATADLSWHTPLLGVGADATPEAMKAVAEDIEARYSNDGFNAVARHAHNAYLQVWYELGVIGSALFLISGLAVLNSIGRLSAELQPFALAQFASFSAMIATSYSIWQTWLTAVVALAILAIVLAQRIGRLERVPSEIYSRA